MTSPSDIQTRLEKARVRLAEVEGAIEGLRDHSTKSNAVSGVVLLLAIVATAGVLIAASALPQAVKAPFQVVDGNNKVIFQVLEAHAFALFRAANENSPVLLGSAPEGDHAFFKAQSESQDTVAGIGVTSGSVPAVNLRYGGTAKTLNMAVVGGKPSMLLSAGKWAMVELGQGDAGAGRLRLSDSGGIVKVYAGTTPTGVGTVETYSDATIPGDHFRAGSWFICGGGCSGGK